MLVARTRPNGLEKAFKSALILKHSYPEKARAIEYDSWDYFNAGYPSQPDDLPQRPKDSKRNDLSLRSMESKYVTHGFRGANFQLHSSNILPGFMSQLDFHVSKGVATTHTLRNSLRIQATFDSLHYPNCVRAQFFK